MKQAMQSMKGFKIDLIVWKLGIQYTRHYWIGGLNRLNSMEIHKYGIYKNYIALFKIDLIVWK